MPGRSTKIALSIVAGCLMLPLGGFAALTLALTDPVPLPPLLQGIGGERRPDAGQDELDHRIRARYPLGSSEAALVEELAAEGFTPGAPMRPGARTESFTRMGFPRRDAFVSWTADENGRLTSIEGRYFLQYS